MELDRAAHSPARLETLLPAEIRRTLHELRVHQIELEMQNEELHRIQEELDASRARYFDLYDLAPVGYCTVNELGRVLEANLTAARLLGVARAALVQQPLTAFIIAEDQDLYYLHRKQLFKSGKPQSCEIRMFKVDGTELWVCLEATAFEGADGARAGRVVMSDISERKRKAEETAKLAAQLIQAQKMETLGCMAGGVAHDFNNLLTVINGYSKMLLDGMSGDDPMQASLAQIHKAGERAAALTRQLLAFSRKQVMHPRRLDLNRLVEDMRPMVERLLGEAVEVQVTLRAEHAAVCADPHQLELVIMNLAVNAHDAMVGGGRLVIETAQVELDQQHYVMLAVSDSGVGMDEETRRRMFEPFFTTKLLGQGTGLGLSMVQGIVVQSGGRIEVRSELGAGTTFKIYLPVEAEEADDSGILVSVPALGGHETLLVVEDREEVLHYAVAALEAFGYRALTASNGAEAEIVFDRESGRIDLVLTDVSMPNMSGGELARRLKRLQPGLKVLFMSGYADDAVVQDGDFEAATQFIQKPFSPKELAGKVRAVLGPPQLAASNGGRR